MDADNPIGRGAPEFRRVIVACPGLATAPFVELQSILEGEAGVRLVSACRPAEEAFTLLVDRGFIADGVATRPRVLPSTLPGVIVGELRTPPEPAALAPPPANGRFYTRDGPAMARALGVSRTTLWRWWRGVLTGGSPGAAAG